MGIKNDSTREMMQEDLNDLRRITANCREDMHEPDGLRCTRVTRGSLDNASGPGPKTLERCVLLKNDYTGEELWVNLASLIALARQAVL